ncbi:motility associated factor glycosyltransferase family protein [Campylobacter lari]|uniref:motility associated factor glycosyltransferase family protein n=1 Tax=Campylobacter lari TaxID=201 RepID=UPI00057E1D19|nr:motility accessory factor [Campylobacter lari]AJD05715.1 motility accessory factor [Campylobacter lari RM16712]
MNELFLKNTQALFEKDQPLALKLRELKECEQFELFQGSSDNLDINILDKKRKEFIYKDPLKELDESLKLFNGEYLRYPVLFFYGLGNGILYKALLSNPIRNHLIIFEEELEIIYLVFHYLDLSEEIRNEKVILFQNFSFYKISNFFAQSNINTLAKIYNFHPLNYFYSNNYIKSIQEINSVNLKSIQYVSTTMGNDPKDSLQGITQLLHNLPYQLANPSLKDLLKQRKDKIENAIIVSTGPSLMKQLPLLKEYANKASIICADSAYPILAKHNIKPDYVLSLERIEKTSEFFNNDFKEFDKGILFILVSMVFPKTIEYLKRNNRQFMLVHRPLPFAQSLNMNDYGYLGTGMSVANMAYELAVKLGHKNIILIGQDLAYDENGKSHPKDYHYFKEDFEGSRKQGLFITAYGGNGKVETNKWWKVFKETFEKDIALMNPLGINTYNATEGGTRIEGSIEKSFKELCENLLKENKVSLYLKKSIDKTSLQKTLLSHISSAENIIQKAEKLLEKVNESIINTSFQNLTHDIDNFKILIAEIDNFKISIYNNKNPYFYTEISKPLFYHYECKISEIFIKNYDDDMDKMQKCIEYLNAGKLWLSNYIDILKIQNNLLKQASLN